MTLPIQKSDASKPTTPLVIVSQGSSALSFPDSVDVQGPSKHKDLTSGIFNVSLKNLLGNSKRPFLGHKMLSDSPAITYREVVDVNVEFRFSKVNETGVVSKSMAPQDVGTDSHGKQPKTPQDPPQVSLAPLEGGLPSSDVFVPIWGIMANASIHPP